MHFSSSIFVSYPFSSVSADVKIPYIISSSSSFPSPCTNVPQLEDARLSSRFSSRTPRSKFLELIFLLGRLLRILLIFLQNGFDDIYRNRKKLFVLQQSVARHTSPLSCILRVRFENYCYPQIGTQSETLAASYASKSPLSSSSALLNSSIARS